ncbi:MAG TPA: hypothetical protein VMF32_23090 [Xanthobacteraceae bacterium]|nr:hypothetical protein [Xanthobacteraceae bacterium]
MPRLTLYPIATALAALLGIVLLLVFGVIPWNPGDGVFDVANPGLIAVSTLPESAAAQIDGLSTMLQGLALGLFVILGVRYKDARKQGEEFGIFGGAIAALFFFAEFLSAYYAYWVRLSTISQLAAGKGNYVHIESLLAYQGMAVLFAAIAALLLLIEPSFSTEAHHGGRHD